MHLEFMCAEEDHGIIPEPYLSGKHVPNWFKKLPPAMGGGFNQSTIKRCMPFLDTFTTGWIIPLAGDVYFKSNDDASGVTYEWKFSKPLVENHSMGQVHTDKAPNPMYPRPPLKFLNYWMIKAPEDYSLLFVPPLNRPNDIFTCYAGIVDPPYYEMEYINFPFFLNKPNFDGIIPAGTPLMQVIPFKKDDIPDSITVRKFTDAESKATTRLRRVRGEVHPSLYRDNIHKKK